MSFVADRLHSLMALGTSAECMSFAAQARPTHPHTHMRTYTRIPCRRFLWNGQPARKIRTVFFRRMGFCFPVLRGPRRGQLTQPKAASLMVLPLLAPGYKRGATTAWRRFVSHLQRICYLGRQVWARILGATYAWWT